MENVGDLRKQLHDQPRFVYNNSIISLSTPSQTAAWIEERKKRYPTLSRRFEALQLTEQNQNPRAEESQHISREERRQAHNLRRRIKKMKTDFSYGMARLEGNGKGKQKEADQEEQNGFATSPTTQRAMATYQSQKELYGDEHGPHGQAGSVSSSCGILGQTGDHIDSDDEVDFENYDADMDEEFMRALQESAPSEERLSIEDDGDEDDRGIESSVSSFGQVDNGNGDDEVMGEYNEDEEVGDDQWARPDDSEAINDLMAAVHSTMRSAADLLQMLPLPAASIPKTPLKEIGTPRTLPQEAHHFGHAHPFFSNGSWVHTVSSRRSYTRDVYDYLRAQGFHTHEIDYEIDRLHESWLGKYAPPSWTADRGLQHSFDNETSSAFGDEEIDDSALILERIQMSTTYEQELPTQRKRDLIEGSEASRDNSNRQGGDANVGVEKHRKSVTFAEDVKKDVGNQVLKSSPFSRRIASPIEAEDAESPKDLSQHTSFTGQESEEFLVNQREKELERRRATRKKIQKGFKKSKVADWVVEQRSVQDEDGDTVDNSMPKFDEITSKAIDKFFQPFEEDEKDSEGFSNDVIVSAAEAVDEWESDGTASDSTELVDAAKIGGQLVSIERSVSPSDMGGIMDGDDSEDESNSDVNGAIDNDDTEGKIISNEMYVVSNYHGDVRTSPAIAETTVVDFTENYIPIPSDSTNTSEPGNRHDSKDEAARRSIYAKGFRDEGLDTKFDIKTFFGTYGPIKRLHLRRENGVFKGSVFIEFDSTEAQKAFLTLTPKPRFKGTDLLIKSKQQYYEEKGKEIRAGRIKPRKGPKLERDLARGHFKTGKRGRIQEVGVPISSNVDDSTALSPQKALKARIDKLCDDMKAKAAGSKIEPSEEAAKSAKRKRLSLEDDLVTVESPTDELKNQAEEIEDGENADPGKKKEKKRSKRKRSKSNGNDTVDFLQPMIH